MEPYYCTWLSLDYVNTQGKNRYFVCENEREIRPEICCFNFFNLERLIMPGFCKSLSGIISRKLLLIENNDKYVSINTFNPRIKDWKLEVWKLKLILKSASENQSEIGEFLFMELMCNLAIRMYKIVGCTTLA